MRLKLTALLLAVVVVSATLGASAYTTGSVSRTSSITVASDDGGLIGLSDGTSGDLVYMNAGQLAIDFTRGGATGANEDATFTLGDTNDAVNASAFNITNQDATAHDLTVSYTGAGASGDGTNNIEFQIYDNTGTLAKTVSEESTSATLTGVASGATYYVVIVVDTTNLDSSTDDLSGTLTVSA